MDFESLLNNAIDAAPDVAKAITAQPTTPAATSVQGTPTSAAQVQGTAAAQAKSWLPWIIGGVAVLGLFGFLILRK